MASKQEKAAQYEFKSKENNTKMCQKYINCIDLHFVYFRCDGPVRYTQTKNADLFNALSPHMIRIY